MRNNILFLLIVLFSLIAPAAHAEDSMPSVPAPAAIRQKAEAIPQRGTLYRVQHQGNTSYLFGTIHVGKPTFFPLEPIVMKAFNDATRLVVELDIGNNASFESALTRYGMYAAGDTIDRHLSRASLAQLQQALRTRGIPFEQVARMKPWMAANLLIGIDLERNGFASRLGTESFLLALAKTQAKPVEELETAAYQLSLFDGMTEQQQAQYLRENLAEIQDGSALKKMIEIADAWSHADDAALEKILREARDDQTFSSTFMQRVLLDKRNPAMADKIETLLRNDKATFVAVGMLHLIGENGLPQLLRQRGYAVQKLY